MKRAEADEEAGKGKHGKVVFKKDFDLTYYNLSQHGNYYHPYFVAIQ